MIKFIVFCRKTVDLEEKLQGCCIFSIKEPRSLCTFTPLQTFTKPYMKFVWSKSNKWSLFLSWASYRYNGNLNNRVTLNLPWSFSLCMPPFYCSNFKSLEKVPFRRRKETQIPVSLQSRQIKESYMLLKCVGRLKCCTEIDCSTDSNNDELSYYVPAWFWMRNMTFLFSDPFLLYILVVQTLHFISSERVKKRLFRFLSCRRSFCEETRFCCRKPFKIT